ncbi:MAG: protein arginine kinase [Planctomycetes bacterium]|nr:protein arginine kinase [Planctomycetota bacterium]
MAPGDQSSLFPMDPGPGAFDLPALWLERTGPERDVVVSSRMRLARNVDGFHFKPKLDPGEGQRLETYLHTVLGEIDPALRYHALHELPEHHREVMFERHLVSREHVSDEQPRAVAFDRTGTTSVMVNEEDHLRIQVFSPGLDLDELQGRVRELDARIASRVAYCFDERFGYITACPTNTGTGLRVSVMLHLPALAFRPEVRGARGGERDIVRMHNAAQQLGLTVRGLFGESSRAEGDFFQISNQVTLGRTAEQTVHDVHELVQLVLDWERRSRETHLKTNRHRLEDHVWRAWALLGHARRMSSGEALAHLSALRLGVCLGIIDRVDVGTLQGLMVTMRPGHLQHLAGRELTPEERDVVRAARIRDALSST